MKWKRSRKYIHDEIRRYKRTEPQRSREARSTEGKEHTCSEFPEVEERETRTLQSRSKHEAPRPCGRSSIKTPRRCNHHRKTTENQIREKSTDNLPGPISEPLSGCARIHSQATPTKNDSCPQAPPAPLHHTEFRI